MLLVVGNVDTRIVGSWIVEDRTKLGQTLGVFEEDNVTLVLYKLKEKV